MISYNYIGDGTKIFTSKEIDKKLLFISSKLKDHTISEEFDDYRIHIIDYYDNRLNVCHETHYVSSSFKLPNDMSKEEIETIYNKLGLQFDELKSNNKIKCISKRR